jgi:integrase
MHAPTMKLFDAFHELYRPLRLRGKSHRTTQLYECCIRAFGRWLGREPVVTDLDDLIVSRYLEARAETVAPLTAERERIELCALARLLAERRVIEFPLTVRPGRLPERVPEAWSLEEMAALLAAAADPATYRTRSGRPRIFPLPALAQPVATTESAVQLARMFSALIPTLWETGERIGAVMDARREDYRRPHLLLRAEARKGSKRDRLYTLSAATCDRIEQLIVPGVDRIFPWASAKNTLHNQLRKIMVAAGLRGDKKRLGFHQIRRTACTHYAAAGGDPRWFLDHENLRTTTKWYLDPRIVENHKPPCDVLPAIFDPSSNDNEDGAAPAAVPA